MFDNGLRAVVADVGDANAVFFCAVRVDVVGAGCRECDELQFWRKLQECTRQADLVGEHDFRVGNPFRDRIVRRVVMDYQLRDQALQASQVETRAHRSEVKEYGFH
jgi:hypothetical protein